MAAGNTHHLIWTSLCLVSEVPPTGTPLDVLLLHSYLQHLQARLLCTPSMHPQKPISLTKQPGIKEEEGSEDPAIGVASEGSVVVHEGQQTPHEEEGAHNHTAGHIKAAGCSDTSVRGVPERVNRL